MSSMADDESESPMGDIRRSKRSTAGNRLRELIEMERKHKLSDDFLGNTFEGLSSCTVSSDSNLLYSTTSNGDSTHLSSNSSNNIVEDADSEYYTETESAEDFETDSDSSTEKCSDSLFDAEENDKKALRKKIYKRPNTRARTQSVPSRKTTSHILANTSSRVAGGSSSSNEKSSKSDKEKQTPIPLEGTRRSNRALTRHVTNQSRKKLLSEAKDKAERTQHAKPKKTQNTLTQEEILEEAKETEKANLLSLKSYLELQTQKKKFTARKHRTIQGPFIRFLSTTRPSSINSPVRTRNSYQETRTSKVKVNLIVYNTPENFNYPSSRKMENLKPKLCAITGLPARYVDPLTNLPYRNVAAFKDIRATYLKDEQSSELNNSMYDSSMLQ